MTIHNRPPTPVIPATNQPQWIPGGKQHRRPPGQHQDGARHMGLLQHQGGHQQQNGSIGHQLQKSDALQAVEHPPGKGPVFIALALLRVPLAQPGGKKEDDRNLGKLRGLELDPQLQPPPGLVVGHSQMG